MRRRERPVPVQDLSGLPAELAAGPQIERWATRGDDAIGRAVSAFSRWRDALRVWTSAAGVEFGRAQAAARTDRPWSREFLLANGKTPLVDFFEGRSAVRPPVSPGRWRGPRY